MYDFGPLYGVVSDLVPALFGASLRDGLGFQGVLSPENQ
jgi:hypothetical protein